MEKILVQDFSCLNRPAFHFILDGRGWELSGAQLIAAAVEALLRGATPAATAEFLRRDTAVARCPCFRQQPTERGAQEKVPQKCVNRSLYFGEAELKIWYFQESGETSKHQG